MRFVILLLLAGVFAFATLMTAWWSVPVVAALWGLAAGARARAPARTPARPPARTAALAAALGWAALLLVDAAGGQLGALGDLFGSITKLPPAVFFVLTLVFPALLAWSAAALAASVWPRRPATHRYVPASRVLDEGAAARNASDEGRAAVRG